MQLLLPAPRKNASLLLPHARCCTTTERERQDVVPVSSCMGMGAKECPSNTTLNVACAEREPRSCHPVFWDYEKR